MSNSNNPLISLQNVHMHFARRGNFFGGERRFHVLKNINLDIYPGEILAIVGESGCGKTTVGKIITGLLKPSKGNLLYENENVYRLFETGNHSFKEGVQFIQQDSYAALNPVRTIYQSLAAPIKTSNPKMKEAEIREQVLENLRRVDLTPPEQIILKYPHQLSGGQRQRVLMARAISLKPRLIVADEPVSMIDVSLRLSILNLMGQLNRELNISFVYITHDLATARYIANNGRIAVMYLGEIVELNTVEDLLKNPRHPYTRALIAAVPVPDPEIARKIKKIPIKSMDLINLEKREQGCSFYPRCPYGTDACLEGDIPYKEVGTCLVKCIWKGSHK